MSTITPLTQYFTSCFTPGLPHLHTQCRASFSLRNTLFPGAINAFLSNEILVTDLSSDQVWANLVDILAGNRVITFPRSPHLHLAKHSTALANYSVSPISTFLQVKSKYLHLLLQPRPVGWHDAHGRKAIKPLPSAFITRLTEGS